MSCILCVQKLLDLLEHNQISYCVLEIDEVSQKLDMFIRLEDNERFKKLMLANRYSKVYSNTEKYRFIYRLEPDIFWRSEEGNLEVHSACQMSCTSMSNLFKAKLPLDESIQKSLWSNKVWDAEKSWWRICDEDHLIYLIVNCVFNQGYFDDESIVRICGLKEILSSESLVEKLRGVFFRFTEELIRHILEEQFQTIIHHYKTFCSY